MYLLRIYKHTCMASIIFYTVLTYSTHMVVFITQDEADNAFLREREQHEHGDPLPSQT